ncbi:MAG: polysaccharide deacetylase family protein [Candidatus Hydrogenedentes bacterium]|nr:polysaccharide deacetylase family protein [Candidatus Hydrogenedentota bacterium]
MSEPIVVRLDCPAHARAKARYVFDTLFLAWRVRVAYDDTGEAPASIVYTTSEASVPDGALGIYCSSRAWDFFSGQSDVIDAGTAQGVPVVFDETAWPGSKPNLIRWDLPANAFYFLSSWSERIPPDRNSGSRAMCADSVFKRLYIPQTVVDDYACVLLAELRSVHLPLRERFELRNRWPDVRTFGVVLSHDEDFIPRGIGETVTMGAKSVLRQLVTHRSLGDALRVSMALLHAAMRGKNPYLTVPDLVRREISCGVRASYQIAVASRHPNDVTYTIDDSSVQRYLQPILDAGFDMCLHGSYRSTERIEWYLEEVRTLGAYLARPLGSRQHYLSFHYDALFTAQEQAGIEYDMSMGYPDACGSRSGFSHPYFPYNLAEDRPYRVLEIPLVLMDVTLRTYLGLSASEALPRITEELKLLQRSGGCASVVWHPILFGGARDPGYDALYWQLIETVRELGGWAGDGRTVNQHIRAFLTG